jgi:hypothetical protein
MSKTTAKGKKRAERPPQPHVEDEEIDMYISDRSGQPETLTTSNAHANSALPHPMLTYLQSIPHFLLLYPNYLILRRGALARRMIFNNFFVPMNRKDTGIARRASKLFFSSLTFSWHLQSNFREHEKDPEAKVPNFRYKISTAYSNLRAHLEAHHKDMYLELCQANGWTFKLPGAQKVCWHH